MNTIFRSIFKWLTAAFYHKLSVIMAALLIYQWIRCLNGYWWEETFTIVNGVLIIATVLTILIPSRFLSALIQFIFLVGWNVINVGYSKKSLEGGNNGFHWLTAQVKQLSPFIWISLGIWAAFHLIVWMRHRRFFIMLIVGSAILSLAIADSLLSPFYLWSEIAWILFIGLGWLVASHFTAYKKQHPDNWEQLLKNPFSLFVPILLIITILIGAGYSCGR